MKKILIVDDSLEARTLLKFLLEDHGFDLYLAISGESAIQMISEIKFDLVISDLEMPNGGGEWLLENLQKIAQPPRVIILSGKIDVTESHLLKKGALAFFRKPVAFATLINFVTKLLQEAKPTE